ncbi:MAG: NHLP leader peptide family RiPP precursor [Gammaproteobacteria bacterium]|nr:NHLP leader peptide family RiPP precursor [Gammaproteobacteria bacterium]MCY4219723.1 NHLP leader peptide family RiPP precursor [Gammaproteobacteria bacterium]MCY4276185.1 NHLP leader peptide family RiPP precursor [Gammaproteobacteria bacterium]
MINSDEARVRLIEKAGTDSDFRKSLLENPTKVVEDEFGVNLPEGFSIKVHEQSASEAHLVLPPSSRLENEDLRSIAGGGGCWA